MSGSLSGSPSVSTLVTTYNPSVGTVPATIAASGTYTTPVLQTYGMPHIAVSASLTQTGTISVQPYLDVAGTIANGSPITKAMTASTLTILDNVGTTITQSITVSIINTIATIATLSSFAVVIQSK
jgi:hypothetical protein